MGEPIFGPDSSFEKRKYAPGQHGNARRRGKKSEYAVQLQEKQKQNTLTVFWSVSLQTCSIRRLEVKAKRVMFFCNFVRAVLTM